MWVQNPMPPTVQAIEPRDQVKVEIVATGGAVKEERRGGQRGGQQDEDRTDKTTP
jgi:hypothetical protein